jgi:hypothetical protein
MSEPTSPDPVRRTCVTVDIENYSGLDARTQHTAQRELANALDAAAAEAGLRRLDWLRQESGDGELAVLPSDESEPLAVGAFPIALDGRLRELHQRTGLLLRVRLAINHGMVAQAPFGHSGYGPVDVVRIADADGVRKALATIPEARVVLALSAAVYRDIVEQGHTEFRSDQFRKVSVPRIGGTAWITVPGVSPSRIPKDAEPKQTPPGQMHQRVEATHSVVNQSGRDTTRSAVGPNSNVFNNDFNAPVNTDVFHIGPRNG